MTFLMTSSRRAGSKGLTSQPEVTGLGGEHQNGGRLEIGVFAQLARQAQAIEAGHVLVGQHQIKGLLLCFFVGVLAVHGFNDLVTGARQGEGDHLAHRR
jgi:hypothetical protein